MMGEVRDINEDCPKGGKHKAKIIDGVLRCEKCFQKVRTRNKMVRPMPDLNEDLEDDLEEDLEME